MPRVTAARVHPGGCLCSPQTCYNGLVQLNMGCGNHPLPHYLNLDLRLPCDLQLDLRDPLPFASHSIERIYAACAVCYLTLAEWERAKREWARVLAPGGIIEILEHNALGVLSQFLADPRQRWTRWAETVWGSERYGFYQWMPTPDKLVSDFAAEGLTLADAHNSDPLTINMLFQKA